MKTLILVIALALMTLAGTMSFADGSDPLPTCRPTATHSCPPLIP